MQRKPTKNTRGPNANEKRFMRWVKEQPCCVCGREGPSIVDHAMGATYKHNKTLIGHWFLLPLCEEHDSYKRYASRRGFINAYGYMSSYWSQLVSNYALEVPAQCYDAIMDCRM